jgi:hypothetical protein
MNYWYHFFAKSTIACIIQDETLQNKTAGCGYKMGSWVCCWGGFADTPEYFGVGHWEPHSLALGECHSMIFGKRKKGPASVALAQKLVLLYENLREKTIVARWTAGAVQSDNLEVALARHAEDAFRDKDIDGEFLLCCRKTLNDLVPPNFGCLVGRRNWVAEPEPRKALDRLVAKQFLVHWNTWLQDASGSNTTEKLAEQDAERELVACSNSNLTQAGLEK